jgi:hypothetical protein
MKDELLEHLRLIRRIRAKRLKHLERDLRGAIEETRRRERTCGHDVVDYSSGERRVIFKAARVEDSTSKS